MKGGMMQPVSSTVKEKKNEELRVSRACRSHRPCGEKGGRNGWRRRGVRGNDAVSTGDGQRKD